MPSKAKSTTPALFDITPDKQSVVEPDRPIAYHAMADDRALRDIVRWP